MAGSTRPGQFRTDRHLPLMGWTGCFPNGASLSRRAPWNRRSSDEGQDGIPHGGPDGYRHRHW